MDLDGGNDRQDLEEVCLLVGVDEEAEVGGVVVWGQLCPLRSPPGTDQRFGGLEERVVAPQAAGCLALEPLQLAVEVLGGEEAAVRGEGDAKALRDAEAPCLCGALKVRSGGRRRRGG